jgi:hypothetical protein
MSEAVAANRSETPKRADIYFEQQIFVRSPFGAFATACGIFLLFVGSFALTASLAGARFASVSGDGLVLPQDTRSALVLSLLLATVLGVQRYAHLKDEEEMVQNAPFLRSGTAVDYFGQGAGNLSRRVAVMTALGVVLGLFVSLVLNRHGSISRPATLSPVFYWFTLSTTFLCVLFTRGLEFTRTGARASKMFIERELVIDLLRIDRLSMVGRSAARVALIWFAVSAVSCLFFVGGVSLAAVVGLLVVSLAMGIGIFVLTMENVHRRIKAAKTAELEHVRAQIDSVRHDAHANAESATKLQGLIAYEARIAAAPEWPFDQTTAMRLGASALILTVPWFGQALAGSVIEHLGQVVH